MRKEPANVRYLGNQLVINASVELVTSLVHPVEGLALWKAARRDQLGWYLALLIINTVGLLPIIYIFLVAPRHPRLGAVPQATTTGA